MHHARTAHRSIFPALAALVLVLTGCQADARGEAVRSYVTGGDAQRGRETFARYGCTSCHVIPGVRGADALVGPPLVSWARRGFIAGVEPNEPERLVTFIRNPESVAPRTAMPNTGVSERDARDMAAYLYTLD